MLLELFLWKLQFSSKLLRGDVSTPFLLGVVATAICMIWRNTLHDRRRELSGPQRTSITNQEKTQRGVSHFIYIKISNA